MSAKKHKTSSSKKQTQNKQPTKSGKQNSIWLIAGIAGIILLVTAGFLFLNNQNNAPASVAANLPKEISVDEAALKRDQGAFILDVRQPEEWQEYHVPGSTLIPLDQLASRLNEVPKDKEVVVVCRSGNRSREGRDILLNANFDQVTSMAGGLREWSAKGYETVSGP